MAFPILEEVTPTTDTSNGTGVVVNHPAVCNVGDLLVLGMVVDQNTTFAEDAALWSAPTSGNDSVPPSRYGVFRRVADGTEGGGTSAFTAGVSVEATAQILRYRAGTWEGTLAGGFAIAASGSNTMDPPNLAPGWGAVDIAWITFSFDSNQLIATPAYTAPTNYAGMLSRINNEGGVGLPMQAVAFRDLNAASEDPGAWAGAGNWGLTIAIRPVADPSGQPFDLINGLYVPQINGIVNPFAR